MRRANNVIAEHQRQGIDIHAVEVAAFEECRPTGDFSNAFSSSLGLTPTRRSDGFCLLLTYIQTPGPKEILEIVRDSKGLKIRKEKKNPTEAVAQNQ